MQALSKTLRLAFDWGGICAAGTLYSQQRGVLPDSGRPKTKAWQLALASQSFWQASAVAATGCEKGETLAVVGALGATLHWSARFMARGPAWTAAAKAMMLATVKDCILMVLVKVLISKSQINSKVTVTESILLKSEE